jgi:hypothetical protein
MISACVLLWALPAQAQDHALLLVGNSYTSRNDLASVVQAQLEASIGWQPDVLTRAITTGGQTLPGHLRDADGTNGDTGLRDALVTGSDVWNTVLLQDQSQIPGFDPSGDTWLDSVDAAAALNDMVRDHGADTAYFLTWGRRDGDNDNPTRYPDYSTMQDRLTEGYLAYAANAQSAERAVTVLPVGEAWRAIWQQSADAGDPLDAEGLFARLYAADGSHPSNAGTFLAAATFTAGLTGRGASTLASFEEAGLDQDTQQILIDAANSVTLADPFGPWSLPWVHPWADGSGDIIGGIQRPLVWLDGEASTDALTLDDAELWIVDEGELSVTTLNLGGQGVLTIDGTLAVQTLTGSLTLPAAGTLRIDATTVVSETATIDGTVVITRTLSANVTETVLQTGGLTLGEGVVLDLPTGHTWKATDTALLVSGPASAGCGCIHGPAIPAPWGLLILCCWTRGRRSNAPAKESAEP